MFPILDVTRLAVRNKHVNEILCNEGLIMDKLLPHIYDIENLTNQMLAFRCICNLMHHEKGEILVVKYYEEFLKIIQTLSQHMPSHKHLQVNAFLIIIFFK